MQAREIKWIGSCNYWEGRDGVPVRFITLHRMSLNKEVNLGLMSSADDWFNNPESQASAHYGVGKDGTIHQYVREEDTAWACGIVTNPDNPVCIELGWWVNPNNATINIEVEGYSGEPLTEAQYNSLVWLVKDINSRRPIELNRDHIIGHDVIDPRNKPHDPGKTDDLFPWTNLMKNIQDENKLYRVQVGAYRNKDNASKLADELKAKGYSAIIKEE